VQYLPRKSRPSRRYCAVEVAAVVVVVVVVVVVPLPCPALSVGTIEGAAAERGSAILRAGGAAPLSSDFRPRRFSEEERLEA
jgi:hypothetical protein